MAYAPQHDAHVAAHLNEMLKQIMIALYCWYDLSDWYACGDELI